MKNTLVPSLTFIAAAMTIGCSSNPPPNAGLVQAHSSYNLARSNADIVNQAPLELKDAGDSLAKAEQAFNADEEPSVVNHLAYLAYQETAIARETSNRKMAEITIRNAEANRNQTRLDGRTAEVDRAQSVIADQQKQLDALNAQKTDRGLVITLGDVLFRTGQAELESGGIRNIEKLADFLKQYPGYNVSIEGHTDSIGNHDRNQRLSERRADAVQSALLHINIGSNRLETRGYGEEYPVASNATAASRQLNRRVEIILSDSNGNIVQR
ncbi:MAG: flagellar motor protein MotB [Methylobacter sp.]|nr:MAG: flagellar motor protein MotB [Methylobacter sp.]PPD23935.1 MAG: flagellar motor protein MotB [Methylobacter sp.]